MTARILTALLVPAALLSLSVAAQAATIEPQVLALIDSRGAKALTCDDAECVAEISAFCMEPGRPGPDHNSPYRLAKGADLALVAHYADGRSRRIDAGQIRFLSQRGYNAVRLSVPTSVLQASGAQSLAVEVGARVALLPVPLPSYQIRHRESEIEAALGPNRIVGERLVDNGGARADGARLLSRLINALPERGEVPAARAQGLWQAALATAPKATRAAGGKLARRSYERCLGDFGAQTGFSLRECLQHRHDRYMWLLNQVYWQSVGPQS
ncbi:MAG: hypothetical protein QF893_07005 [Alphaproteobacteria bacterium]|jgi:hypothetical protein|nr:hypothetical protein [Alphaproteobacteria bacterium]